ncbi:hypothetical protein [Roseomonas sp. WA12]
MNLLARAAGIARSPGDPVVQSSGPSSLGAPDQLARGLGWFSFALGAAELFGARPLARALGMRGFEPLIRFYGAREIVAGMATLSATPQMGVVSRIAGDAIDIITLLAFLRRDNPRRNNVEVALVAVVGVTLLDILCQAGLSARHSRPSGPGRDYSNRSGFPNGVAAARRAAASKAIEASPVGAP